MGNNNGQHKFKCEACGKHFSQISSAFKSCIHTHPAAGKIPKAFCLVGEVRKVSTQEPAFVCQKCTEKLISAMASGGNVEAGV